MRLDHWIKQFFIFPGVLAAIVIVNHKIGYGELLLDIAIGFLSTSFVASSNYVINEWLDAEFDKYHPVKKHRSVVENNLNARIVYAIYFFLGCVGLLLGWTISQPFFLMVFWLWVMGICYNVKPMRTKDIPFVDVLTESINNAIRLLIGWFIVTKEFFPPISIVIGYWFAGAFLMATKRFAEYRMIHDKEIAGLYRKSFRLYSEQSLLLSSFFYAMTSVFFVGIFLIKYRVELILFMPALIGLFCYYFLIAFKEDSAAQKPEKLFKEKVLMAYVGCLAMLFTVLMVVDLPFLNNLANSTLIPLQ